MNGRQKIVQDRFLNNEEAVIRRLKSVYNQSLKDIEKKAQALQDEINRLGTLANLATDAEEKSKFLSMQQSKIYQKQYQDALKKQIGSVLDNMQVEEFKTVSEYLQKCYEDGFIGTLYDLQGQGIPLIFPMDQEAMVRAVQLDSKISQGLYSRLGEDIALLKRKISAQVSRGIATGASWQQMAKQLSGYTNIGYNNAVRITRTEGHRVQVQSAMDACYKAREKGADIVKQWDATLDGRTRPSHFAVDGEVRELDKPFSNGLMFPGAPQGAAAEVINCRCALLERARWAVGGGFTKMNNFTKEIESFESPEAYAEFKKAFFSDENRDFMNYYTGLEKKYGTKNFRTLLESMSDKEYDRYIALYSASPVSNKAAKATGNTGGTGGARFASVKLAGIDDNYIPDIQDTLDNLMRDYPLRGIHVKTHSSSEEFGHSIGGIKGVQRNGEQCAIADNEISLSKQLHKNKGASISAHRETYSNNLSKLENAKRADLATIPHEYAHAIDNAYVLATDQKLNDFASKYKTAQKVTEQDIEAITDFNIALSKSDRRLSKEIFDALQEEYGLTYGGTIMRIAEEYGMYASSSISEFLAEGFANMRMLDDSSKTDFMRSFEDVFNRKFAEVLGGQTWREPIK